MREKDLEIVREEIERHQYPVIDCPKCGHKTYAYKEYPSVFSNGYFVCMTCGGHFDNGLVEIKKAKKT